VAEATDGRGGECDRVEQGRAGLPALAGLEATLAVGGRERLRFIYVCAKCAPVCVFGEEVDRGAILDDE
jgi:hypothetical protein